MKEVKIEDFISKDELDKMTEREREIYEKCFLLNKQNLQGLNDAQNLIEKSNKFLATTMQEYINESQVDIKKMHSWYTQFKGRYYTDIEKAYSDIRHVVNHNNKQYGEIFGYDSPDDIIALFNFIDTQKGIEIKPKVKKPKEPKPELTYETDSDLISKQKRIWSDYRGIEIGRYLGGMKYIDTNSPDIYGTEKVDEDNVFALMHKLKKGIELPPILLDYDYGILDGHHRWEAAKRLNIKKIPVVIYEIRE